MILEFEDEKGAGRADPRADADLFAGRAAAEGALPLSVFIRVTDDDEIRTINRESAARTPRRTCSPSDGELPAGKTAGACEGLLREEFDPDVDACAIGDIVISMDHVRAQAAEYGHSERRECGYLLTHGLFHLMGYDHMTDEDKPVMRAMEEKALASIGLTREE
ncbi:MAG: rRNA maturation RNase YbeY [Christensenellales bacterium]